MKNINVKIIKDCIQNKWHQFIKLNKFHKINIAIIIIIYVFCIAFLYVCLNRLIRSSLFLFDSFAYYFVGIFNKDSLVSITPGMFEAIQASKAGDVSVAWYVQSLDSFALASNWDMFVKQLYSWFFIMINYEYFQDSTSIIIFIFNYLNLIILLIFGLILTRISVSGMYFSEKNAKIINPTKPLKLYDRTQAKLEPAFNFIREWHYFNSKHKIYQKILLFTLLLFTNVLSCCIDSIGYLLQWSVSFNFSLIFKMLFVDLYSLTPTIRFLPGFIWLLIAYLVFDVIRVKHAKNKINDFNQQNKKILNVLGSVNFITGVPGGGKTTLMTQLVLDCEEMFRNKQYSILIKYRSMFPCYDFKSYEKKIIELRERGMLSNSFQLRIIVDLMDYVSKYDAEDKYNVGYYYDLMSRGYDELLLRGLNGSSFCFGFKDVNKTYYDGLKPISLFEMLRQYGRAFYLYSQESPNVYSNYAIRFDYTVETSNYFKTFNYDLFAVNNADLFRKNSKFSKILNFDEMRLGKTVSKSSSLLDCGVVAITEVDKERGNRFDTSGMQRSDRDANLLNDYFNQFLKLSRHPFTIDYYPFMKILSDSQREGSVNADLLETGEAVIDITKDKKEKTTLLLWVIERTVCEFLISKNNDFLKHYNTTRNYDSLIYRMLNKINYFIYTYYIRRINNFTYAKMNFDVSLRGISTPVVYFLLNKKIYSERFATDCYYKFFEAEYSIKNNDHQISSTYKNIYPSKEEFDKQNSFLIQNIEKYRKFDKQTTMTHEEKLNGYLTKYGDKIAEMLKNHDSMKKIYESLKKDNKEDYPSQKFIYEICEKIREKVNLPASKDAKKKKSKRGGFDF